MKLGDGSCTIFLSTRGENEKAVPPELVRFLKFVTADLKENEGDFQDRLVSQLQKTIRDIKTDREMGERYMTLEELLKDEKQEGRMEGRLEATRENILELLEELGPVPDQLRDRLEELEELEALKALHKMSARADSIQAFKKEAEKYLQSSQSGKQ